MSYEVYKVSDHQTKKMPLKLLYITRTEYDKGWHSTRHTHHFTELLYIVKGKGYVFYHDNDVLVKENDLVIINPNVEHTEKSNQRDSLEYFALGIEGLSFSLPDETGADMGLYTYSGDREDILFYLDKMLQEVKHNQNDYEVVCQNIIEILIVKLKRAKNFAVTETETKNMNRSVSLIKHYINQNYRQEISLDDLAEAGHISKFYLSHSFKNEMGSSPIKYLQQVRVREAKILLETTNYSIANISEFIGFSSQSFFTQSFKLATDKTPSQYRKVMKKE